MIGSLAEGLAEVVAGEVATQANRRQGEGSRYLHHGQQGQQQQRQQPAGPLAGFTESVSDACNRALVMALTGFQYLLIFEALLLSAVVLYGALYWAVMPLRLHDKPLFFDYSSRATSGGATATVDFLAQHTQWDPSPLVTVDHIDRKILRAGQHYLVGLELQMPTSYINRKVGVFMVHTTLLDGKGNELATSARPAMLPHTSALRKGIGMFFSWPLYLLGIREEADTVFVSCMDFYQESALHPLAKAKVTVSSGRVQFYRASVHITPQLKGLPWLMHDWFYSTLALGVLFITSLELIFYGFYYVFFLALDPDDTASRSDASGNTARGDSINIGSRGQRGRFSNTGRAAAAREGSGSSQGGHYVPSANIGDHGLARGAGATAIREETVRRRHNAGTGSWGTGLLRRPLVGENSAVSTKGEAETTWQSSSESPSVRPGLQEYQRGARYVIEGRGIGNDDTSAAAASSVESAASVGSVAAVGTAACASGSGGGTGAGSTRTPSIGRLSKEEEDNAAMASWAALGGGVNQGGGGSAGGSGIGRVVGDDKPLEESDSVNPKAGGGAGREIRRDGRSVSGAEALTGAEWVQCAEEARDPRVHDLTDR